MPGTDCDIQWSAHIAICQCVAVSEVMKPPHSAERATVAEQANRRLRRLRFGDNGLTVSNGRAVPPATERGVNSLGFTLMNSRSVVLQATP